MVDHLHVHDDQARGLHPLSLKNGNRLDRDHYTDPNVTAMLKRTLANAELLAGHLVTDEHGTVLAAFDPALVDKPILAPIRRFRRHCSAAFWFGNSIAT